MVSPGSRCCDKTRGHGSLKSRCVKTDGDGLRVGGGARLWERGETPEPLFHRTRKECPFSGGEAALSSGLFCLGQDTGWAWAIARGCRPDANGSLMACDFRHLLLQPSELKKPQAIYLLSCYCSQKFGTIGMELISSQSQTQP